MLKVNNLQTHKQLFGNNTKYTWISKVVQFKNVKPWDIVSTHLWQRPPCTAEGQECALLMMQG